jgi:Fe2+ transport system protein FeoA
VVKGRNRRWNFDVRDESRHQRRKYMSVKKLNELKKGDRGKVVKVSGVGSVHQRLMDMGLITGSEVEMQGVAPLGDPIEIRIKGYNLSLRKSEAACISVEVA